MRAALGTMEQVRDEIELLRRSAAGDKEAFGFLVERHQTLVYAVTYSLTGSMEKSEELGQETFLQAWLNLRQLRDPGRFRAWLCTIARNLASRTGRNQAHDVLTDAGPLEEAAVPAEEPGPVEMLISRERQEMVWAALRRIPLKYREPMVLFYSAGRSVREVADELELSEHVVCQRLYRGRQLLNAEVAAFVEDTLSRAAPGNAFAIAVVAALPAIATPTAGAGVAGTVAKGAAAAKTVLGVGFGSATLGAIIGLLGGILGWIGGLLGGILGTRADIRRAKSPRERRFVARLGLLMGLLVIVLIALPQILFLVGVIPKWVYWSCWAAFFLFLLPLISWSSGRQQRIQIEDGTYRPPEPPPQGAAQSGPRQSFVGPIFGPLIWVLIVAAVTGDWITAVVVLALGFAVLFITRRVSAARPERPFLALLVALLGVGTIDLGVVCLRWRAWQQVARFNEIGGVVPFWMVALAIVGFVAAAALGAIIKDRRRSTLPLHPPDAGRASRSGVFGALAGAIFGSTAWLATMTLVAGDSVALAVVVIYTLVVFLISARICAGRPHRLGPVLLAGVTALYVLHMVVLNLRWSRWMAFFAHAGRRAGYHELSLAQVDVIVTAIAAAMALLCAWEWAADRRRHREE
jgi:RNA polymerase sigma factor (sigma-70 family)